MIWPRSDYIYYWPSSDCCYSTSGRTIFGTIFHTIWISSIDRNLYLTAVSSLFLFFFVFFALSAYFMLCFLFSFLGARKALPTPWSKRKSMICKHCVIIKEITECICNCFLCEQCYHLYVKTILLSAFNFKSFIFLHVSFWLIFFTWSIFLNIIEIQFSMLITVSC